MRSFILYGLLVGLPVAGISVVLEKGRDVRAPLAVWGDWSLQFASDGSAPACGAGAVSSRPTILTIEQSGDRLTLSFDDSSRSHLSGRLDWRTSAPLVAASATDSTGSGIVNLHAAVDRDSKPRLMRGIVILSACGVPTTMDFTANRHSAADAGGATH